MLKNINPRERLLIVTTIIFTVVVALWVAVYEPFVEKQEIMMRKIDAKTKELAEVSALAERLAREQLLINRFEMKLRKKPFKGSLLAKMESLASDAGIRKNIASMAPSPANEFDGYRESTVAIKIEKATLPGLVHFLESISATSGVMLVKRISIRPKYGDPSKLDVSLAIANYGFAK